MTDQKDYTQEPGGGHLPDLHPYDYTRDERVLAACGWVRAYQDDHSTWYMGGDMEENPVLTMQELWEGLCRVCKEAGHRWNPEISGLAAVLVNPDDTDGRGFVSSEYGTLTNAIAAALYTVLQRGVKVVSSLKSSGELPAN